MKPYLKTTLDVKEFIGDNSYDFLLTDVRLDEGDDGKQSVVFDRTDYSKESTPDGVAPTLDGGAVTFPIKDKHVEDDIHQRITKAIWDGLGGDDHAPIMNCVYISAAESQDDTFYVNVVRTKPKGAE